MDRPVSGMLRLSIATAIWSLLACGSAWTEPAETSTSPPWLDSTVSPDIRADLVLARMTSDEELVLLKGYYGANVQMPWIKKAPPAIQPLLPGSAGFVPGIARLGIPALRETDAGVGIANTNWMRAGDTATAFPSGLSNAATWNPELVFQVGSAIGAEARDRAFNVVLDGALNLAREPRGGRTFEYAGEDPLLAGTIVGAQVRGIQSQHVLSTLKHFALNDQEIGRGVLSANIDDAGARESDLLAFEIAIEQGNPGAIMCAYNRVNSGYACENEFLLNRVLKHDWGFAGWVLSDWGAVHSSAAAANSGLDQESASGFDVQEYFGAPLHQAIADRTVSVERVHDMAHRILRSMFASGVMDYPATPRKPSAHVEIAERDSEEGIVLLKNAGGVLPLTKSVGSIAIIGAQADLGMLSGGGSSQVLPLGHNPDNELFVGGEVRVLASGARIMPLDREIFDPPSPLAAISRAVPHARVRFVDGADVAAAARLAARSDVAIVFAQQWMSEGNDVPSLALPGRQDALIDAVAAANPRTIVVLETGGPVLMPWLDKVSSVLEAWYAGNGGAQALTRILFGEVDPSGRLPISFPASEAQLPRPVLSDRSEAYHFFDVAYTEGSNVGYRWFAAQSLTPLFPFGFGLSYTTFDFRRFQVTGGENVSATIDVSNIGSREGSETVQLYAQLPAFGVARLIGWSKVRLSPGETRTVALAADPRLLARFDTDAGIWRIAHGDYAISVRTSATDIKASAVVPLSERTIKP